MEKKQEGKTYYVFLLLLAITIPSGIYFITYGILSLLLGWAILQGYFRKYASSLKRPQALLPAFIYFITVIYFFISENRPSALGYLSAYLAYLVPAFIITGPALSILQRKNILKAFIISLCISLLGCILYGAADIILTKQSLTLFNSAWYHKLSSYGLTRLFPNWHPTYVATFGVWSVAFIVSYRVYYKTDSLFKPLVEILILLFLLFTITLLSSIAAILALLVVLIGFLTRHLAQRKLRPVFIILFLASIIGGISLFVYKNPFNNNKIAVLKERGLEITDTEERRNFLTIRIAKWISHIEIFKAHPIFGTSPADIKPERKKIYLEKGFQELATHNYNAHNQYIETLCRFGITGLLIFLLFLLFPLFQKRHIEFYLPFVIASGIVFLTESFFERQQGLMAFMFIYGLLNKAVIPVSLEPPESTS